MSDPSTSPVDAPFAASEDDTAEPDSTDADSDEPATVNRTVVRLLAPFAVGWFVLNLFRAALPVLLPEFRRLYGVAYGDAGILFGLLFAGLALAQLPSGLVADAVGDARVMGVSVVGSSVILALFGVARSLVGFVLLAFLLGAFVGSFRSVAISAVTKRVSTADSGGALGVMAAGNPLGNLLGPILTAAAVLSLGVSRTPIVFGVVGVGVSLVIWWLLARESPESGAAERHTGQPAASRRDARERSEGDVGEEPHRGTRDERSRREDPGTGEARADGARSTGSGTRDRLELVARTLTTRRAVLIVCVSLAFSATWQGVFAFLPSFLVETKGLDLGRSGLITGLTFGTGIVVNVAAGRLADRVGHEWVMFGGLVVAAAGLLALPTATGTVGVLALLVLFSAGLNSVTPARDAFIGALAPPADRGSVVGGVRTVYILLASGTTVVVGMLIERAGFTAGFSFLAALLLVGVAAGLGLVRLEAGTAGNDAGE